MQQHVERLGDAWCWHRLAFDDCFVGLRTAHNVVGLDGEDFLKDVTCTEGFDGPDFHFSETLTTELCFTTEWLLRDERVWTNGAGVHLVFKK